MPSLDIEMAPDEGRAPNTSSMPADSVGTATPRDPSATATSATGGAGAGAGEKKKRKSARTPNGVMVPLSTLEKLRFGPQENPLRPKHEQKKHFWDFDDTFGAAIGKGRKKEGNIKDTQIAGRKSH